MKNFPDNIFGHGLGGVGGCLGFEQLAALQRLYQLLSVHPFLFLVVVAVYHVTIVAIGHGMLKKFWPLVLGCVLRTAGRSII